MPEAILVVDDEPELELLIEQKFRKQITEQHLVFRFAANGEHALELLAENQDISLILTDIRMPGMDGLELLEEIKSMANPVRKTIMVSAYADMGNIRTAMNRGAYDFITKPVDLNDLVLTIDKALKEISGLRKSLHSG
ncbi:MAG: response regulator [Balneolales bacterium]